MTALRRAAPLPLLLVLLGVLAFLALLPSDTARAQQPLGTLSDSFLVLFHPDSWVLADNDNHGDSLASRIVWRAPSSGEYYAWVGGSGTGSYTLAVSVSDVVDDYADSSEGATTVVVGEAVQGGLEYSGDEDFFVFEALEGAQYQIDVGLGTLGDSLLVLYNSDGRHLEENDDHGDSWASRIVWRAARSGEYFVKVGGYGTGSYTLTITQSEVEAAPSTDTPSYGGTLSLAIARGPFETCGFSPYDPGYYSRSKAQINSLIFSRLARRGASGIEPDLAESWSVSSDGTEWTVRLKDARFHDGSPVTAADVIASIQARIERFGGLPDIAHHSQTDDLTLSIRFAEPASDFMEVMSRTSSAIVPEDMLDAPMNDFTDLVGSGPFIPVGHHLVDGVEVQRNPDYYEPGLPRLDRIEITVVLDPTARVAAYQVGRVDYLGYPYIGLPAPSPEYISYAVDVGGSAATFPSVLALWFDTQNPPFDYRNARLAVLRAIDAEYFEYVLGAGELQGVIPDALFPGWNMAGDGTQSVEEWHSVDMEAVRSLLTQAGYPDGFSTTVRVYQGLLVEVAQLLSDMLASANNKCRD